MAIEIRQVGPCFAGEVEGLDMTQPLSSDDADAIHAGMDEYAVLTIREQPMTPEQQLAFTLSLGEIEPASRATLRDKKDYRLPSTFQDVSNLDKDGKPLDFECDGLLAHCIQHEIDHLDGKLFVDYLSRLKRERIRKQLERELRRGR